MSIFDNAKAISIGGRSVSKLKLDGATIWSKKTSAKWDLADRTWVTPASDYSINESRPFAQLSEDAYVYLVAHTGVTVYHSGNASRVFDITETGFSLTNGGARTGVGLPYRIRSGDTITLSLKKNANCQILAAYYDTDGYFDSINLLGNVGTELTLVDTAPIDGWAVVQFCPYNANQTVTFSDIVLSIT